jgi:CspA family cold shock protein
MATGKVAFFHDRKGYGFIETDEADDDVFFHMDDIDGPEPSEGQEVEFEVEQAPKGPRAKDITFL